MSWNLAINGQKERKCKEIAEYISKKYPRTKILIGDNKDLLILNTPGKFESMIYKSIRK